MTNIINMDFALTRFNHQVWKIKLKAFLDGKEQLNEAELASHHECDLGKWIYGIGLKEHGNIPEMSQLERAHADLHKSVRQIVGLYHSGHVEQAKKELNQIAPLSEQVVSLITIIEAKTR